MKDDAVYLRHIIECFRRIEENIAGGREQFMASHTLQDAVLRNLQTMTESTQRLSDALRAAHPEVEWPRIIAFRNVLVHDYLGIDLERISEIIQRDVPTFKRAIAAILGQKSHNPSRTMTGRGDRYQNCPETWGTVTAVV